MPIRVTILSREDCHLCDVVYRMAIQLQSNYYIEASKVDYRQRQGPHGALWDRVPVVLIDEVEHFSGNVTEGELRRSDKKSAVEKTDKPDSVPPGMCSLTGVIISLGLELPRTSSDLPEDLSRASWLPNFPKKAGRCPPIWPCIGRRLPCR